MILKAEEVEIIVPAFDCPPQARDWVEVSRQDFDAALAIQNYTRKNWCGSSYYRAIGMSTDFACETSDGKCYFPRLK